MSQKESTKISLLAMFEKAPLSVFDQITKDDKLVEALRTEEIFDDIMTLQHMLSSLSQEIEVIGEEEDWMCTISLATHNLMQNAISQSIEDLDMRQAITSGISAGSPLIFHPKGQG